MKRVLTVVTVLLATAVSAQNVPGSMNFNARLTDTTGMPLVGGRSLQFRIFDQATGGSAQWTESASATFSAEGTASVELGATTQLTTNLFDGRRLFLEVQVDSTTLTPRIPIVSVPYALRANVAASALSIGALAANQVQQRVTGTCSVGQAVTAINADGTVTCASFGTTGPTKNGTSSATAAPSCRYLLDNGFSTGNGSYWLESKVTGEPNYQSYCDMTTEGGGWTLAVKLRGDSNVLNRKDPQWLTATYTGNLSNVNAEDGIGPAYKNVAFTDVMIRSLATPAKNLGWRHPTTFSSLWDVIRAQTPISTGGKLFGSIANLDFSGTAANHNDCSDLQFGFYGFDWSYRFATFPGRYRTTGHTGAIIAASRFYVANDITGCVSDFGMGAGYYDMVASDDQRNIQGHRWGNGNDLTADFLPHGLFVR